MQRTASHPPTSTATPRTDSHSQIDLRGDARREALKTRVRDGLQWTLEKAQFRFDTFPRLAYQPLPWLGMHKAGRSEGTIARWSEIEREIIAADVQSAVDIGCQAGYFTLSLGERGIPAVGIDNDARSLRMARYAAKSAGIDNVGWEEMTITPQTITLVPSTDAVLLLSVWHHWVWAFGFSTASEMLTSIWERCDKVLFFETGEEEMPPEFGLPDMKGDPGAWIESYLRSTCPGSEVQHLGRHQAFGVGGNETENVAFRHLFAVRVA